MADATGDIELTDDKVLVVRRVHVKYRLAVEGLDDEIREIVDRCMEFHVRRCPVARTLEGAVDVSTEMELIEAG